jgi:hypothetical protein
MTRFWLATVLLVATAGRAWADDPANGNGGDPDRVPGLDETSPGTIFAAGIPPLRVVEGAGIKVGEGTVIHAIVGADTGVVSNVFYEDTGEVAAGMFRIVANLATGSLPAVRLHPTSGGRANLGSFQHGEDLRLSYDFFLSGNDYVSGQNGLGIAAVLRGRANPQGTWSFLYLNTFERVTRSPNFESNERLNRDINRLTLGVQYAPVGRSVRALLHYENTIDVFERDDHQFANTMRNGLGLTAAWRFRPVTALFVNAAWAINNGIGGSTAYANEKASSYPLILMAGIQTLLTLKTSLVAQVGYTNGFYSAGASYSNVTAGVDFGYRYSPLGRASLQYQYLFADSINANFYRDHVVRLRIDQQFVPIAFELVPEVHVRRYEGIMTLIPGYQDTRDDLIFQIAASGRYYFRDSLAAVLQYRFTTDQTDYLYTADMKTDDPSYSRHELIAGVRAGF